jgi:hypothetical protein
LKDHLTGTSTCEKVKNGIKINAKRQAENFFIGLSDVKQG